MRIDGSTLNPFRELQVQSKNSFGLPGAGTLAQETGQNVGQDSDGFNLTISSAALPPPSGLEGAFDFPDSATASSAASMSALAEQTGAPESTADAFALEMARRMQGQVDANGEAKDTAPLTAALSNAVEWIRDQHGDMTANAVMATVLGETGDAASEQSVSNGLVKALKLVDEHFGAAASDAAVVQFNGALNRELNAYFDNGRSEEFLAVTTSADGLAAISSSFARQAMAETSGSEQSVTEMLQEPVQRLMEDLEESTSPEALAASADTGTAATRKALAAYGYVAQPEPQLFSVSA